MHRGTWSAHVDIWDHDSEGLAKGKKGNTAWSSGLLPLLFHVSQLTTGPSFWREIPMALEMQKQLLSCPASQGPGTHLGADHMLGESLKELLMWNELSSPKSQGNPNFCFSRRGSSILESEVGWERVAHGSSGHHLCPH